MTSKTNTHKSHNSVIILQEFSTTLLKQDGIPIPYVQWGKWISQQLQYQNMQTRNHDFAKGGGLKLHHTFF